MTSQHNVGILGAFPSNKLNQNDRCQRRKKIAILPHRVVLREECGLHSISTVIEVTRSFFLLSPMDRSRTRPSSISFQNCFPFATVVPHVFELKQRLGFVPVSLLMARLQVEHPMTCGAGFLLSFPNPSSRSRPRARTSVVVAVAVVVVASSSASSSFLLGVEKMGGGECQRRSLGSGRGKGGVSTTHVYNS